jgi:hypothetical protein
MHARTLIPALARFCHAGPGLGAVATARRAPRLTASVCLAAVTALAACGGDKKAPTGPGGGIEPPPTTPAISVAAAAAQLTLGQSASATVPVAVTRSGGFTGAVSLALEGAPAGVSGAFDPAAVPADASSSTLTLGADGSTAPGTYTVTIRGHGQGVSDKTTSLSLTVTAAPAGTMSLAVAPAAVSVAAGASGSATVTVSRAGGFAGPVTLGVAGAPAGVSATLAPAQLPGGASTSTVAVSAGAGAMPGTYSLTIQASGDGVAAQNGHARAHRHRCTAGCVPGHADFRPRRPRDALRPLGRRGLRPGVG